MKIVIIHGQDHKGSTYHIARKIAEKISVRNIAHAESNESVENSAVVESMQAGENKAVTYEGNEITEFFLPRDLPFFCKGCYACIEDATACPFYKEKRVILDKMEEADILIFSTPTYCSHVSAAMKSFFELIFDYWMVHRPNESFFRKRAVVVSSSAGSSAKSATKDIAGFLFYLGVPSVTQCGIAVQAMNWEGIKEKKKMRIEKDTDRIAAKVSRAGKPRVGIKIKFMFNIFRMMQNGGMGSSPVEKEYWEKKGWLGKNRPWKNERLVNTK